MKKLMVLMVLLVISAGTCLAQGGSELSLAGGYAVPLGNMTDSATPGFQLGGAFGFHLAPRLTLGAEVNYSMLGLSDEMEALVDAELGPDGDLDLSLTQYGLFLKSVMSSLNSSFYSRLNLGMYKATATASLGGVDISDDETDVGLGVGLGYQSFGLGRTGGFVEANLHYIFSEGESSRFLDLRAGVTFKFL